MITRRVLVGALMGITMLALGGCGRSEVFRYKMTIEVETPEGVKTGSSVRQVRYSEPGSFPSLGESRPQWSLTGEAVAVDLSGGKVVFALLTSGDGVVDYAGRDIDFLFRELGGEKIRLWPNPPLTTRPRIANPVPMLATFQNLRDPKSMKRVDPDNLEASIGMGYRLKAITVQLTDEPVTLGIERRLVWLPTVYESLRGSDFRPEGIPVGDFKRLFSSEIN